MSRSLRASAHARRDAALRRLRVLNRILIGGAVAATGLLTDVTAHAFTGHKRRVAPSTPATALPAPPRDRGEARHHHARHVRRHRRAALRPPARPPASATTTAPQATTTAAPPAQTTPAQTTPAQTTPAQSAPAPAPSPTVSGGS
jgi:hypothetical protein